MIGFLLFIRVKDIPKPVPESPFKHLDERKAAIYENLRDLQFEYRLDKLSDQDYQTTKLELQKDLAQVMAETDRIKAEMGSPVNPRRPCLQSEPRTCARPAAQPSTKPLKFCGECGKPMPNGHGGTCGCAPGIFSCSVHPAS